jgi:hypothetical protein
MARSDNSRFVPSADAFAFTNTWPSAPAVTVQTPLGPVGIGNAANGLCGGMVFAALDYWHAGRKPPRARPAPGSPLYKFIVSRLIASWHLPAGVAQYYHWMNLPDGDSNVTVLGRTVTAQHGLSYLTIEQQWPQMKSSIDAGVPAALGVVTVASANPAQLGVNHQVLAWGYETGGAQVTVRVYDPNTGPSDDVTVSFDTSAPAKATTFASTIDLSLPVRGFFVVGYSPAAPPEGT